MSAKVPITVITSTYNWPAALRVAIRSALAQTFTEFEYLVVGDGCTDDTADVVAEFDDPRLRWTNLDENLGNQSDVNRKAIEMARGEVIAYLNHDDIWFPEHLAELHTALSEHDCDVVNSLALAIWPPGFTFRQIVGSPWRSSKDKGGLSVFPMTTNIMHTIEAARAVGSWRRWKETADVPTQEYFRRLREYRGRFATVPLVTSLKFNSGDRRNSYRKRSATEQESWWKRMQTDPGLRHRELALAYSCKSAGEIAPKLRHPKQPLEAPKGWQIEQYRRLRGLPPMLALGESEPGETEEELEAPDDTFMHVSAAGSPVVLSRPTSGTPS